MGYPYRPVHGSLFPGGVSPGSLHEVGDQSRALLESYREEATAQQQPAEALDQLFETVYTEDISSTAML